MYAGGVTPEVCTQWVFVGNGIERREVTQVEGLQKLYNEAFDNVMDNHKMGVSSKCEVFFKNGNFICSNDGSHISITKNKNGDWWPSVLFFSAA